MKESYFNIGAGLVVITTFGFTFWTVGTTGRDWASTFGFFGFFFGAVFTIIDWVTEDLSDGKEKKV